MKPDLDRSVLLVIDVQNDFCPGGALGVPDGDAVIAPINRLVRRFRHVVATQDWHPPDHVSFASNWPGRRPYDTVDLDGSPQVLWPDHCVQGTRGAELHADLHVENAALVVRKGVRSRLDSYSALFENDHSTPTELVGWLRSRPFETLYLAGLATDYCVFHSAMDALRLGFAVLVVGDAVRGVDVPPGNVGRSIERMRGAGARFIPSDGLE